MAKLVMVGLLLVIGVLLLVEVVLRLSVLPQVLQAATYARDTANPGLYQLDDAAGYVMVPGYHGRLHGADFDQTFETNSRGLRDVEIDRKQASEFRIVVLGDSFVMGAEVPVEQRFTNRLEALLHERGFPYVRVVNVGVRGWGTYNEAGFLATNIDWLQPDLVVLSIFVGNIGENVFATAAGYELKGGGISYGPPARALEGDSTTWFDHNFRDGAAEYAQPVLGVSDWKPADGLPKPHGNSHGGPSRTVSSYVPTSPLDAARTWLHTRSMLYGGLSATWFRLRFGYERPDPLMLDNWLVYTLRRSPHQYWYDVAIPLTAYYVEAARETAAHAGAPLVAMVIPRDAQIDNDKLLAQLRQYHLSPDEIDLDAPQRNLSDTLGQMGIPMLDLALPLRASGETSRLFFRHDLHFTAVGHALTAQVLADWIAPLRWRAAH